VNAVIDALGPLTGLAPDVIHHAFLVFLRVGAMMALVPAFGEAMVPARVRLVLALSFTAITLAAVAPPAVPLTDIPVSLWAREAVIGLAMGMALRMTILALLTGAAVIAQATALSQLFGAPVGEPTAVIGNIASLAALALAVSMGLHVRMAELLIRSYTTIPLDHYFDLAPFLASWNIAAITRAFAFGMSIAAPFVVGGLLFNLALGVANRALAALPVSMIATPAQIMGGILALAALLPLALSLWSEYFIAVLSDPFAIPK
jgi:flagellar biosynthetic protein FliR